MRKFGNRLLLGMSIPTLDNTLTKIYEPKAPAPTRRLALIERAIACGISCYVAMAPTFPESDEEDIRRTLSAFAKLPLWTIFHESVNARASNVDRIIKEAQRRHVALADHRHLSTTRTYAFHRSRRLQPPRPRDHHGSLRASWTWRN